MGLFAADLPCEAMRVRDDLLPVSGFFAGSRADFSAGLSAGLSLGAAASPLASEDLPSEALSSLPLLSAPAGASLAASLGASASGRSARLRLLSLSPLKSVSYQPPPLRRNTGADIRRCSCDLPQWGHFFSGRSVILCIASRSCPQFLH